MCVSKHGVTECISGGSSLCHDQCMHFTWWLDPLPWPMHALHVVSRPSAMANACTSRGGSTLCHGHFMHFTWWLDPLPWPLHALHVVARASAMATSCTSRAWLDALLCASVFLLKPLAIQACFPPFGSLMLCVVVYLGPKTAVFHNWIQRPYSHRVVIFHLSHHVTPPSAFKTTF